MDFFSGLNFKLLSELGCQLPQPVQPQVLANQKIGGCVLKGKISVENITYDVIFFEK